MGGVDITTDASMRLAFKLESATKKYARRMGQINISDVNRSKIESILAAMKMGISNAPYDMALKALHTALNAMAEWYAGLIGISPSRAALISAHYIERRNKKYQRHKAWRKANRDRENTRRRQMPESDRQRAREAVRQWREANRDWCNLLSREWCTRNPDKVKIASANQYAKRKLARAESAASFSQNDIDEIRALQRNRCAYCRQKLAASFHIDHIVPLAKGGHNGRSNIQLTCRTCNTRKGARHPIVFAQALGFLI